MPTNEKYQEAVVKGGFFDRLPGFMDHVSTAVRLQAVQAVSNLLMKSTEKMEMCFQAGFIQNLVDKMALDSDYRVRNLAAKAVSRALSIATLA